MMTIVEVACFRCKRNLPLCGEFFYRNKQNKSGFSGYCKACAGKPGRTFDQRFWSKVNKSGPVARDGLSRCWLWTGYIASNGYGQIGAGGRSEGLEYAHRVAWRLGRGEIPNGMCVLHLCDVRSCVRHLFLGTYADNNRDMAEKGRARNQHTMRAES